MDIELQKVAVELGVVKVQQIVGSGLDVVHNAREAVQLGCQPLDMGVLQQRTQTRGQQSETGHQWTCQHAALTCSIILGIDKIQVLMSDINTRTLGLLEL